MWARTTYIPRIYGLSARLGCSNVILPFKVQWRGLCHWIFVLYGRKYRRMENGLMHIYHGNGKGKTTAAVGLAVRAAGAGMSVMFAQFMNG